MRAEKQRAARNRTISLSAEEAAHYAGRCKAARDAGTLEGCLDSVFLGDALEILARLPDDSVDLLIADPPYNLAKRYGGSAFPRLSNADYVAFTEQWVALVKPKLKKTASAYVCCDWRTSLLIAGVLEEHFLLQNRITWQREKGRGAQRNWKNAMEDIWFATLTPGYTFNARAVMQRRRVLAPYRAGGIPKGWEETAEGKFRDTYPSNFWDDLSVPYWSMPENTDHPAQKPEKLVAKLVLASSNPGDVVLDPFAGVGTTAVVARKLGRRFIAVEREAEYCALAQKRLELAAEDGRIQGYVDGVFWERNTQALQKKAMPSGEK